MGHLNSFKPSLLSLVTPVLFLLFFPPPTLYWKLCKYNTLYGHVNSDHLTNTCEKRETTWDVKQHEI